MGCGVELASTSVHFPKGLLEALDRAASDVGVSRNRLVIEACRKLLEQRRRKWPPGFFDNSHLTASDLDALRDVGDAFTAAIEESRQSSTEAPF